MIKSIELSITQYSDLIISAYHQAHNDSFVIEIQEGKVQQLVSEFGGDYSLMAEHLKIMNKRMVLLNPVSTWPGW